MKHYIQITAGRGPVECARAVTLDALQYLQCDGGAGFGICQGVMVILHVVAAGCGRQVELVAGDAEMVARGGKRAVEFVARVFHAVLGENGLQAPFVERTVVCHERQPLDSRLDLRPYLRKGRLAVGVTACQAVDLSGPAVVIIWRRLDQAVELVYNLASAHHDDSDAAHAGALAVGCLKIYGYKILHFQSFKLMKD